MSTYRKEYYEKNRDKLRIRMKNYWKKYREEHPEWYRKRNLEKRFGITLEQYEQMAKEQNYLCAICKRPEIENRRLSVDHDHETGEVRQLLCSSCNVGLGRFQDSILVLEAALDYLKFHKG